MAGVLNRVVRSGISHRYTLNIGFERRNMGPCFIKEENCSDLILALGVEVCVLKGGLFKTHNN